MKNLLLIFMMLFAVDSIAQLDQREKGDVISPALNKNPNFIQKTGWTIEAIDPINDTLCSVQPSPDNLTILTANVCNARVYQDINSADIRKARFDKETMTVLLKLQSLTYVKITLNVYKKAATTGTLTLLRTRSLENNSNVPLRDKKIIFDVVTDDLNFVPNAELADSLRIEFTFEPTVVFPAGVAKVEVNDFRVFSSPLNYSPLLHEVREESGWTQWQPITITAATTNPTITSSDVNLCRKRRNGTQLEYEFYLDQAQGSSGAGDYRFSCGGMQLNGQQLNADYDATGGVAEVGSGMIEKSGASGGRSSATIFVITSNELVIRVEEGTLASSLTKYSLDGANSVSYRFTASVAIKEWRQNVTAAYSSHYREPVTKYLSSNITATTADIADFKFTDLVVGDRYRIEASITYYGAGTNAIGLNEFTSNQGGVRLSSQTSTQWADNAGGTFFQSKEFVATSPTLSFSYSRDALNLGTASYVTLKRIDSVMQAYLLESNIEKDVEQFHTDERKICDRCYKGKALYKKCATTDSPISSTSTEVLDIGSPITGVKNAYKRGGNFSFPTMMTGDGQGWTAVVSVANQNMTVIKIGSPPDLDAGIDFCVEYLKD